MAQHWGEAYYHFVVEALPRITVMLDILQENVDIKVPLAVVGERFVQLVLEIYS